MNFSFEKLPVFNGKPYASIQDAQRAALIELFPVKHDGPLWSPSDIAEQIIENRDEIVDVLTTTINSKPSARKINGGTKKRKPKAAATTEQQLAIDPAI